MRGVPFEEEKLSDFPNKYQWKVFSRQSKPLIQNEFEEKNEKK